MLSSLLLQKQNFFCIIIIIIIIIILTALNTLNAELNPICQLLVLIGAHPILHVSRIRVNNNKSM
jgi:hypothetical protein